MRIAILPARGGSKRIRNKNTAPFAGRPMIAYPLEAARESGRFDKIHVSTDSPEIAAVAAGLGHQPDFPRAAELADDTTPVMPVLRFVLEHYRARGQQYRDVCLIYPCTPLLRAEDLRQGFAIYDGHQRRHDLLTVTEYPVPVEWAYDRAADGRLAPRIPGAFAVRSQDLEPAYFDTGTFAIFAAERVLSKEPPRDTNYVSLALPRSRVVDIDTPEDWALAEILYRGMADG